MSIESTRQLMNRYWSAPAGDTTIFADDVVYTMMSTGEEAHGPEAVRQMVHEFYQVSFNARAETTSKIIADGHAVVEGYVVGTHIGEFAGIPATGKEIRVPLCVVYDLEDEQIKRARIYFETPVLLAQLGRD